MLTPPEWVFDPATIVAALPEWVFDPATIVAALALAGTLFSLILNRGKTQADAHKADADAAGMLTDTAQKIVMMYISASEARCEESIRQAVAHCEERLALQDRELAELKAWVTQSLLDVENSTMLPEQMPGGWAV